jgi:outer membrane protein
MSTRIKLLVVAASGALFASPVGAVDLVGVHDLAVQNDPRLKAASFRLDAAGENRAIARSNLLPQIGADGTWTRGDSDVKVSGVLVSEADTDTSSYGVSLFQSIYDHANYERLDIARSQTSQAEATYEIAYQDFLLRVAERYFLVLTLTDTVTFAEAEEKAFQRQFEQAEQRFEVGLTAVTDVHEARASYDNARARAIVARNDLEDAKEALRELTGQYFDSYDALQPQLPLVEPDPVDADQWVDIALQNNPYVLAARYAVDVAENTMQLERSGHYPTLGFSAGWNRFTNNEFVIRDDFQRPIGTTDLRNDDTSFRLLLDIPIYQGGRVNARTRQARYLLDATGQDLDDTQRGVVRETQNAYRAVLAGIQEVQAFEQASISAESALEATQAGFEVGTRTIVDVLIAEQRKYQAQRDNSVARHAYIIRHLRLKSVAGLLDSEDLAVVNQLLQ